MPCCCFGMQNIRKKNHRVQLILLSKHLILFQNNDTDIVKNCVRLEAAQSSEKVIRENTKSISVLQAYTFWIPSRSEASAQAVWRMARRHRLAATVSELSLPNLAELSLEDAHNISKKSKKTEKKSEPYICCEMKIKAVYLEYIRLQFVPLFPDSEPYSKFGFSAQELSTLAWSLASSLRNLEFWKLPTEVLGEIDLRLRNGEEIQRRSNVDPTLAISAYGMTKNSQIMLVF